MIIKLCTGCNKHKITALGLQWRKDNGVCNKCIQEQNLPNNEVTNNMVIDCIKNGDKSYHITKHAIKHNLFFKVSE